MRRTIAVLVVLGLGVAVIGLFALLRRSPELDAPGFTASPILTSVYEDRPGRGRPAGAQTSTMYGYRGHPWRESVAALGRVLQAHGFVRDRGIAMPAWRRGEERVYLSGGGDGRSLKMTRTSSIGYSRPATVGDRIWQRIRGDGLRR